MSEPIRKIVIVGGGSAGWMAAAGLTRVLGKLADEIVLVESSDVGTVGVGEATLPTIRFFNASLGLDEVDFIRHTNATFKLGIEFRDWYRDGDSFFHGFSDLGPPVGGIAAHELWLKVRAPHDERSYEQFSITTTAARMGRFAPPIPNRESVLGSYSYGYHFDATLYANYLRHYSEERGVQRIDARIVDIRLRGEDGFVEGLVLADGRIVTGDLFLDCSGFAGLVIRRALAAKFDDWSHWLPCNRAFAVACENGEGLKPFTRSTARTAGWQWRIPLQHRVGNGYVFCDAFTSEDEAAATLSGHLEGERLGAPRLLRFTTGRVREAWTKNCVAIGLAAGFLEPLESTSIHLIESAIGRLIELFPQRDFEPRLADEFNRLMARSFESIRDFIILHYHASMRDDEFWRQLRAMSIPDELAHQIELFRASGQVVIGQDAAFAEASWISIFFGQRVWPRRLDPMADLLGDAQAVAERDRRRRMVEGAAGSLPDHSTFIARFCKAPARA